MITAMMVPNILFFKDKPPTSPSFTSDVEKEDFGVALKLLRDSKDYIFICISFSMFYGSFTIIAVILNFLLVPFKLGDPLKGAVISAIPMFSGMVGCIISSIYLKKYEKYKKIIVICMLGSTGGLFFFLMMLYSENFILVCLSTFALGLFIVPLVPAMLEFACETCFPIGEATCTGFIYALAHIFGGIGGMALTALLEV